MPPVSPPTVTRRQLVIASVFVVAHVVLAVALRVFPVLSTLHALATLAVGVTIAATTRRLERIAAIVAYIVGAEVMWRMTKAGVFWEFGKYASIAVLFVGIARLRTLRHTRLPLAYFGLLLPSTVLTLVAMDLSAAREQVSFTLAGPFAIACAVIFFSNLRLTTNELRATFVAAIGPIVAIAALAFLNTRARAVLEFINAANAAASGGFGPNQVSAMLGMGILFSLLMIMDRTLDLRLRGALLAVAAALAAQAALTFSRGGILLAFAGAIAAGFFLIRGNSRTRIALISVAIVVAVIGKYWIEPRLEETTGGKLRDRYSNLSSTGRDEFARSELRMFFDEPALGVGPGVGTLVRKQFDGVQGASHTEYSRMLAEHGIFGLAALGCLLALVIVPVRAARDLGAKSLAAAFVVWAALFLLINATRLAAPALMFGLAHAVARASVRPPVKRALK